MQKSSKIYIAGHRGMVGSAIKRKLEQSGYSNLIYAEFDQLDLMNQSAVMEFFESHKPEYVILAAAKVGGIMANNTYRAQFIYENLMIQNNVIHHAYLNGTKKLLFLGSSCIYPRLASQPIKEDSLLTNELEYTNEPYAIAKIAGIKMIESYNLQYGTEFLSVMPTNLYGPNDNYDLQKSHVLPALIRKMHLAKSLENADWTSIKNDLDKRPIENTEGSASNEIISKVLEKYGIQRISFPPGHSVGKYQSDAEELHSKENNTGSEMRNPESVCLKLWGTGSPMREFMHVDDLAAACVYIMEKVSWKELAGLTSSNSKKEVLNTHINLGTGKDLTIRELAEIVKDVIGFSGNIEWDASKPDGTPRKLLDVSKMKGLGFEPTISLKEGIRRTYSEYLLNK